MKLLIVVDMQEDFIHGVLGTKEAKKIIPAVVKKVKEYKNDYIIFTLDQHFQEEYLSSIEGKHIPIPHCIINTIGADLVPELKNWLDRNPCLYSLLYKEQFGSLALPELIEEIQDMHNVIFNEIEIIGVCTDKCVLSNALIVRAGDNTTKITIDSKCCAGSTPEMHGLALKLLEQNCIDIIK